ncbi:unnamed protein product [Phytomonas sp. EM1]|nr:unnamed protein product [Phytomonas sp. EM1]|eukprot:CCW61843.1 unnamed protein product [Phytomonas sp. isolate EM1]
MELVDSAPAAVSPTEGAEGGARGAPLFSPATVFSAAVMAEVEREVRRLYTAEQREFLQRAPDLFVALEDLDRELPELLPTPAESMEREGEEEGEGWDSDFDELRAGNRDSQGASTASMYHLATGGVRGASRFPPALVLLSPRVLVPSGTVGWAGEGTVFVNAGGVHHAQASISASIAV